MIPAWRPQPYREAAGDGKERITPAMGRDIIDSLTKQQGFVSPDLKDMLDSVVDGGKLTPETMKKLHPPSDPGNL